MDKQSSFQENPDNRYDTEMRLRALKNADTSHSAKLIDEERIGVPSFDESLVSDYIRNRVAPPDDIVSGKSIFKVETPKQPEDDYQKELKKLASLSTNELDELLKSVETESKIGHGLFSKGDLLKGYALDPETLMELESQHHESAMNKPQLADEIIKKLGGEDSYEASQKIERRIIIGLVYYKVPGFETPIVKIWLGLKEMGNRVPDKIIEKIANYIKASKKYLPISADIKQL